MKRLNKQIAGAQVNNAPRTIGEIIAEMKTGYVEPFGKGYHGWIAEQQGKEVRK